jgi:hypothetical protein
MSRTDPPTSIFNMPQKPIFQFGVSPAIALLRRFVRHMRPFLVRPFEGAAEERPLTDGLKQIARTLQAMGALPEDQIVKQIGSEFRQLFCPAAKMKSQPGDSLIDPVKSISDLLREPPPEARSRAAAAALRRFVALCKRPILSRSRRSFL